jgi:two-component system chemotaxis response regulator CheB
MVAERGHGATGGATGGAYRVMVVDDSAVVRGMTARFIEEDPELEVVASVGNGQRALDTLERAAPEVVVLDIEMPIMDGLTALPKLLEKKPGLQVIMSSTLTKANADVTIRALSAGAADYITKPSNRGLGSQNDFQSEIRAKVKALAAAARRSSGGGPAGRRGTPADTPQSGGARAAAEARPGERAAPQRSGATPTALHEVGTKASGKTSGSEGLALRRMPTVTPQILAIGSSTGGPQALLEVLGHLGTIKQPVLITQHMPATFTSLLADHIGRQASMTCSEARDGDQVTEGHIHVAPGGYHMVAERDGGSVKIRLSDAQPENFCRPSVDPMLRSLVDIYGAKCLALILTGMGHDGLKGCETLVNAGGHVIAQDEATSVVWGMPGAVAKAGLCSAILPLKDIAPQIRQVTMRSAA